MLMSAWLGLLGICLAGAMSPGPSLAVVLRESARGGRRAGLACALAHGLGVGLYALATVAGLSLLLVRWPLLADLLQAVGAAYLVWLGWRAWTRAGSPGGPQTQDSRAPLWQAAGNGLLVAVLNPKLALFMLALFSQFLPERPSGAVAALLVATAAFTDALWYALVAVLAGLPGFSDRLRRRGALIERVFAVLLTALGLMMLARLMLSGA
ncbi:MAG: lysine transporter LysE [Haliea sp.]|nr:lysine transporter LysE [Haliea sp.]MAL96667.1 lysine transporter LysE [Haliea sp.]|tara:strand:- start:4368 stop:4997 length:630 start_codon:yes stop_codon:yes gene_type:complete